MKKNYIQRIPQSGQGYAGRSLGRLTSFLKYVFLTGMLYLSPAFHENLYAQCGYATGLGCPGTNYSNFGYNSNTDAATLEYDNFTSTFHASIVRDAEGKFQIWGERTANNGTSHQQARTEVNVTNYPNLTGTPLKAAMGSNSNAGPNTLLLTTTGLFAMGTRGTAGVLSNSASLTPTGTTFVRLTIGGGNGLPGGVAPADVKMMFATHQTLAIVTCSGDVWVLSQNANMRGNGSTGNDYTWSQVTTDAGGNPFLTNVIAVRGASGALIALTASGALYTWGPRTFLGNSTAESARDRATLMTAPKTGTIKMIGATHATSLTGPTRTGGTSYYVLYADGELYSLGRNNMRQLGNWPAGADPTGVTDYPAYAEEQSWVQPRYPNTTNDGPGAVMDDIVWISPNEHDGAGNACINVINSAGRLWNWGTNSGNSLGRSTTNSNTAGSYPYNPGQPLQSAVPTSHNNFHPDNSVILGVETGGHTTLIVNKCETNFGYVGHATNGSAGNTANTNYSTYTFTTTQVNICGAESEDIIFTVQPLIGVGGKVCASQSVTLTGMPPGGTLSIVSGPGTLSGNVLSFTATTGTVRVRYEVTGDCGTVSIEKDIEIEDCPLQHVTGRIWIDNNANAELNTGENGTNAATSNNGGLWANLVDDNGEVVASVPVAADGTYSLATLASTSGTFSVEITNAQIAIGTTIPPSARTLPNGWAYTGNNNSSNTPCLAPACSHTIPGITLSGTGSSGNDFGIQGVYTISGNVFHDANGLTGGSPAVDGNSIYGSSSPYETQSQPQLYISVIDGNGNVIHYVPVANDGSYTIDIPLEEDAILQLSTNPGTIGSPASPATLPSSWTYAGEDFGTGNDEGSGVNDGTGTGSNAPSTRYDGRIVVSFPGASTNITGVDFGIQQPPVTSSSTYTLSSQPTSGNSIPFNGTVPATSGTVDSPIASDPENTPLTLIITQLPYTSTGDGNPVLYYNGVEVNTTNFPGLEISNFDPSLLSLTLLGIDYTDVSFDYKVRDAAGAESGTSTYRVEWGMALPLELLHFTAGSNACSVSLQWTYAEQATDKIKQVKIERSSDGKNFEVIATQKVQATTYTDVTPYAATWQYRLATVLQDASSAYSRTIAVKTVKCGSTTVSVHPNPTTGKIQVVLQGNSAQQEYELYDITGGRVLQQGVLKANSSNALDISSFAAGSYILRVVTDGTVTIQQLQLIK